MSSPILSTIELQKAEDNFRQPVFWQTPCWWQAFLSSSCFLSFTPTINNHKQVPISPILAGKLMYDDIPILE